MEESVIRIVMLIRAREIQRAIKNGHRQNWAQDTERQQKQNTGIQYRNIKR
jgi:hypothetical protein